MIDGVTKVPPLANEAPPLAEAYQLMVPVLAVAVKVTLPFPQRFAGVVAVIVGLALTLAITAVLFEVQLPFDAST